MNIEQLYIFRRPDEVTAFLATHPFLAPLLLEAHGKIVEYFGPSEIILEVITDPEAIDDHELFALIRVNLSADEALVRLDRLDAGWWLDVSRRGKGKFNIHVEFV